MGVVDGAMSEVYAQVTTALLAKLATGVGAPTFFDRRLAYRRVVSRDGSEVDVR